MAVHAVNFIPGEINDSAVVGCGLIGLFVIQALRMIAGLETATSGEIYIGDTCVNDMAPKDRDVAMVFQNYALPA